MKYLLLLPLILCLELSAQQITITSGSHIVCTGSSLVVHNMGIQNNGSISATAGKFVFSGNNNAFISGSGLTQFNNVEMALSANNKLTLNKNIKAIGNIVFNGGLLDLGNAQFELEYPSGMLINENENSRIIATGSGEIFTTRLMNAPSAINPGNLGIGITSSQNLGLTTVRRGHMVQTSPSGDQSIRRYYNVVAANANGLNADVTLAYFDAELNNNPEASLGVWRKNNNNWAVIGRDAADAANNRVMKSSLGYLGLLSLGKDMVAAPLPLQLISFTVSCDEGRGGLQWITANETGTAQFVIEKSSDALHWEAAGVLPAAGNTFQHTYRSNVAAGAASYFRLKMEDSDGKFTYSPVRKMDCNANGGVVIGPNPTTGSLVVTTKLSIEEALQITVSDMNGRAIRTMTKYVRKGSDNFMIDLHTAPAGTYLVMVRGEQVSVVSKIVKM